MSKIIALADVAKHNTEDDCFMAIHGKVYDVTKFLDEVRSPPALRRGSRATLRPQRCGRVAESRRCF